jgi:hypothetical protein
MENNMKKNSISIFTVLIFLVFSFETAVGQEISSSIQSELSSIYLIKKNVEQGQDLTWQIKYVESALSKEKRAAYFKEFTLNEAEKKALDTKLNELAQVSTKFGITLEGIEESGKLASNPALKFTLDEIIKITGQVQNFNPKESTYIVTTHDEQWLKRAISKKEREKWAEEFFGYSADAKDIFYKRLDKLSVAAAKAVPTFKPNPNNFANHNPADEAMMKKQLDDQTKIKIHQIGLAQANWDIQKNDLDIPQKRYKVGYIWGKDSRDDFAYCRLYQVNIIQDYMGGGKYGASYGVYLESWVVGCP